MARSIHIYRKLESPAVVDLRIVPKDLHNEVVIRNMAAQKLKVSSQEIVDLRIVKRSIDARKKPIYQLRVQVALKGEKLHPVEFKIDYPKVHDKTAVAIIGMGPAGMFAALRLIEYGLKPVIFERGKKVRARRRDLAKLTREHIVDPDSNYCFGEGGAGTYSDGKLYTRSGKRGSIKDVLQTLVAHGADADIMVDAHPHIGTNRLPEIIEGMRETILEKGGEIHFEHRVNDIVLKDDGKKELVFEEGSFVADEVILATGHSARDIFELFDKKHWQIESKTFAMGVRIEHPQELIDKIQYRQDRGEYLPPAAYSLVCQVDGRGVYSFCMCPGGIIAPCATAPGEIVTNGWSPSKRNNPYANSGMVVGVEAEDLESMGYEGPLAGLRFQQHIEQKACELAGGTQQAPAQRLVDFIEGKVSSDLPQCSYKPGVKSIDLRQLFPPFIADRLAQAFVDWGKRMKGFMTNDAILVAPESRTSSPVRIPRDNDSLEHPDVPGLYPCGEGAGYAGGIVSAAMDGQRVAAAIQVRYSPE